MSRYRVVITMSAPILVTGSNRSGTTWLGKLLAAGEGVGYINELFNPDHPQPGLSAARFPHWFMYLNDRNGRQYAEPLGRALRFEYDWRDAARSLGSPRDAVRAARALPRTRVPAGTRPLLKDPIAVFSAGWLERTFGMRVVLTVRHPAGFAASLKRLNWQFDFSELLDQPLLMADLLEPYRPQIEQYAAHPPGIIEQAGLLWKLIYSAGAGDDWLVVRQEDLSLAPEQRMRSLYEELGLAWSDRVAAAVAAATGEDNPVDAPEGRAHTEARNSRAAVMAWRNRLTDEEIARTRALVEPVASRYYADDEW